MVSSKYMRARPRPSIVEHEADGRGPHRGARVRGARKHIQPLLDEPTGLVVAPTAVGVHALRVTRLGGDQCLGDPLGLGECLVQGLTGAGMLRAHRLEHPAVKEHARHSARVVKRGVDSPGFVGEGDDPLRSRESHVERRRGHETLCSQRRGSGVRGERGVQQTRALGEVPTPHPQLPQRHRGPQRAAGVIAQPRRERRAQVVELDLRGLEEALAGDLGIGGLRHGQVPRAVASLQTQGLSGLGQTSACVLSNGLQEPIPVLAAVLFSADQRLVHETPEHLNRLERLDAVSPAHPLDGV
jgi:hypothetical protein